MNPMEQRFSKPPTTKRGCLKCGRTFNSTGPENRICDGCQKKNAIAYPARCEFLGSSVSKRLRNAIQDA